MCYKKKEVLFPDMKEEEAEALRLRHLHITLLDGH